MEKKKEDTTNKLKGLKQKEVNNKNITYNYFLDNT